MLIYYMCILQDTKWIQRKVNKVKKVISAAIYQVIQFDDESEFEDYIFKLKRNNQEFILEEKTKYPDGKVEVKIMKQYNKNKFIERGNNSESK